MNRTIAAVLIALGVVVLGYSGISYTTSGETHDFLGMRFETTETHYIPPVVGALALIGGIVLLLVNNSRADRRS